MARLRAAGLAAGALTAAARFGSRFVSLDPALLVLPFSPPEVAASGLFGASASAPARLRLRSWSDLKSVSYQPLPFKRNTGAEMSFTSVMRPQEGHFFSGASVIFCITSV